MNVLRPLLLHGSCNSQMWHEAAAVTRTATELQSVAYELHSVTLTSCVLLLMTPDCRLLQRPPSLQQLRQRAG